MNDIKATHEIHERRMSRNVGVGLTLGLFVVLILGLTIVKVQRGDPMERFDHVARPLHEIAAEADQ